METYPEKKAHNFLVFVAGEIDIPSGRARTLGITKGHGMPNRTVQHDTQGTIGAHDNASGFLSIGLRLEIEFEGAGTTLLPFFVVKVVQLALGCEFGALVFFAGFNWGFTFE